MKKQLIPAASALLLTLSSWVFAASPADAEEDNKPSCHKHAELKAEASLSDASLYQLGSKWTDQNGKQVALPELAGRARLVTMVYTTCVSACPMLVGEIKNVMNLLPPSERAKVSPAIFTFDPERDTPEKLKAFSEKMKINDERWQLLTGSPADVAELAGALGVQFKKLDSGDYVHSNAVYFLNEKGEIVAKKEGLKTPAETFVADIKKALRASKK